MENNIDPLRFLTIKQVAVLLQISLQITMRMVARKELPAFKGGGQWRVRESEIAKWLQGLNKAATLNR